MIMELIAIAIVFMIVFGLLKKLMYIGVKVFGIGLVIFIILALLGFIL